VKSRKWDCTLIVILAFLAKTTKRQSTINYKRFTDDFVGCLLAYVTCSDRYGTTPLSCSRGTERGVNVDDVAASRRGD